MLETLRKLLRVYSVTLKDLLYITVSGRLKVLFFDNINILALSLNKPRT